MIIPKIALELLVLANHLMDKLETTRKTRRRKRVHDHPAKLNDYNRAEDPARGC